MVAAPSRAIREEELEALQEGDAFVGGKLVDAAGNDVPVLRGVH